MKRQHIQQVVVLISALLGTVSPVGAATPVTPDASPEARALLNFIYQINGKKTLSGQMWAPWGIDEIDTVQQITGKLPAVRGQDYNHELVLTRDELPNIMDYLQPEGDENTSPKEVSK